MIFFNPKKGGVPVAKFPEKSFFGLLSIGPKLLKTLPKGFNTPRVSWLGSQKCPQYVLSKKYFFHFFPVKGVFGRAKVAENMALLPPLSNWANTLKENLRA